MVALAGVYLPDEVRVEAIAKYVSSGIVQTGDNEHERRFKRNPLERRAWQIEWMPEAVMEAERLFELAGTTYSFLMRPPRPIDYQETGQRCLNTVTGLGTGDGATATFQLQITRTQGGLSGSKNILHPIAATVAVYVDGTAQVVTTAFAVSETTGIITFTAGHIPGAGATVTADFEYDTAVRFQSDELQTVLHTLDERVHEVRQTTVIEVLDE